MNFKLILAWVCIVVITASFVSMVLGALHWVAFWIVVAVTGAIAYLVLPKIKK